MSKEDELMSFLYERVFDSILNSQQVSENIKSGVRLTVSRMERLDAEGMIQYYWSSLSSENSIAFSKKLKALNLPRFEDVLEDFRDKFNDRWLKAK